jgi:predicted nucleic acid-binding protein
MNAGSFLDSNILVYTDDHDAPEKRARAMQMVEHGGLSGRIHAGASGVLCGHYAQARRERANRPREG